MNEHTTPEAADKLGISSDQFRRLVKKRGLVPSSHYTNPHYRTGPRCPKWSAKDIGGLKRTKDLQAILDRAKPDPKKAKEKRRSKFMRKYFTTESLLVDACTALFSLNRYAKWPSCSRDHRDEIYLVKNRLVELLCGRGLADRA